MRILGDHQRAEASSIALFDGEPRSHSMKGLRLRFGERLRCVCSPRLFVAYDVELGSRWLRAVCRRCNKAILVIELDED
jgi:hypothetical protein